MQYVLNQIKSLHIEYCLETVPLYEIFDQNLLVNLYQSFLWLSNSFYILLSWRSIIDHLLTHEKTMFKDLMSKYQLLITYFYINLKSICI